MMNYKKILIVDDNVDLADGVADVLEFEGHDVAVVYSGRDAIAELKGNEYNYAFVDIRMPDINGIEVLKQCRDCVSDKIILMTGYRIEQIIEEVNNKKPVHIVRLNDFSTTRLEEIESYSSLGTLVLAGVSETIMKNLNEYYVHSGRRTYIVSSASDVEAYKGNADVMIVYNDKSFIESLMLYDMVQDVHGSEVRSVLLMDASEAGATGATGATGDTLNNYQVAGCLFKPVRPEDILSVIEDQD